MGTVNFKVLFVMVMFVVFLNGCSGSEEPVTERIAPVHFESGDECHVCGMVIQSFPGPKGQAIDGDTQRIKKFCSTRDLMAWKLQPENVHREDALFVHDMAQTEWDHVADTALVPARSAVYVVGSRRRGAMGPTLASFAEMAAAEAFALEYGGEVVAFDQLTLDHLMMGQGHSGYKASTDH